MDKAILRRFFWAQPQLVQSDLASLTAVGEASLSTHWDGSRLHSMLSMLPSLRGAPLLDHVATDHGEVSVGASYGRVCGHHHVPSFIICLHLVMFILQSQRCLSSAPIAAWLSTCAALMLSFPERGCLNQLWCSVQSSKCAMAELNMPRTDAGLAFGGCGAGVSPELAACLGRLTRMDLSNGSTPMAAADAAALVRSCSALRWLGAPSVRQPGAHSSPPRDPRKRVSR